MPVERALGLFESLLRCCDDDLGVWNVLVEFAVLTLLVGGGHKLVALRLDPFSETKLVLCGSEQLWLLLGVLVALESCQ